MEVAARIGWLGRGVLYVLLAVLVAQIPSTGSERSADKKGAFEAVAESPFGGVLLAALIVGLLGFSLWRAWSAVRGTEEKTNRRIGWAVSSLVYAGLAVIALVVLLRGDSGGNSEKALTVRLLELPAGPWIVGAIGVGVLVVGANYARKGVKKRFLHDIEEGEVPQHLRGPVRTVGVIGWLGRALVWGLVGWFVVRSAVQHDPSEPIGLDETLRNLADEPYGPTLLWIAAAAMLAYAVLCAVTARWPDPDPDQ